MKLYLLLGLLLTLCYRFILLKHKAPIFTLLFVLLGYPLIIASWFCACVVAPAIGKCISFLINFNKNI